MTKFQRNPKLGYTLITPDTPLDTLEVFLRDHLFALGMLLIYHGTKHRPDNYNHQLVTDQSRKFVLGVATAHDLEVSC